MTAVLDLARDQFDVVFGSRRGRPGPGPDPHARIEERDLTALLGMPQNGQFVKPLKFVQRFAGDLGANKRPSQADILAMALGSWMTSHCHELPEDVGKPFGYTSGLERRSFQQGVTSRIAEQMEDDLVDCPPEHAEEWAQLYCERHAPDALVRRLMGSRDCFRYVEKLLGANPAVAVWPRIEDNTALWRRVAEIALDGDTPVATRNRDIRQMLATA